MSDRASTELKWHQMLENYRKNILPDVVSNWEHLSEDDKRPIERLSNFYCGLHSFVQLAEVTALALGEVESKTTTINISGPQIVKSNEPGTIRLIRTAAKSFSRGGDAQSGCYGDFKLYIHNTLKENGINTIPIVPFRGNRFNIIFFNGGYVYFLHQQMISYLEGKQQPNQLLKAVLNDLKQPFYIAGCKALGLLNKMVMAPLWNIIENKNIHVMDMNCFMADIIHFLKVSSEDVSAFMNGNIIASDRCEWILKRDSTYDYLIQPSPIDTDVEAILSVVIPAITKLLQSQYSDFLKDGQFFNTTFDDRSRSKSVEKHNKFAERVFAYTDQLLRFKPNITHISQEAYIMFSLNKTSQWLSNKPQDIQDQLVDRSRKSVTVIMDEFFKRRSEIEKKRLENQTKKRKEEETRKEKKLKERDAIFKDILYYGLYQSDEEVSNKLKLIKGKLEKEDALKAQVRFRQTILGQEVSSDLYRFSEKMADGKRRFLTAEELAVNVRELINLAAKSSVHHQVQSPLIGKQIHHLLSNEENEVTEYLATVLSCVPGYPMWFNLKYDGYEDIYVEKIHTEIDAGNIKVL